MGHRVEARSRPLPYSVPIVDKMMKKDTLWERVGEYSLKWQTKAKIFGFCQVKKKGYVKLCGCLRIGELEEKSHNRTRGEFDQDRILEANKQSKKFGDRDDDDKIFNVN